MIWFGVGIANPIVAVALSGAPAIALNVAQGVRAVDADLIEMAHVFRFAPRVRLARLWIPALAPFLLSGARFGLSLSWKVIVLVPMIVLACRRVHAHYEHARQALTPRPDTGEHERVIRVAPPRLPSEVSERLAEAQENPTRVHSFAVVPVAVLDLAALHALAYAVSLSQPVLALHVSPSEEEAKRFHRSWQAWGDHLPLEIVVSPYRSTVAPLANYIAALHRQRPDVTLTLVVPEIVVARRWQRILHNRTAARLRASLIDYEGIVITTVPFHLPR